MSREAFIGLLKMKWELYQNKPLPLSLVKAGIETAVRFGINHALAAIEANAKGNQ